MAKPKFTKHSKIQCKGTKNILNKKGEIFLTFIFFPLF